MSIETLLIGVIVFSIANLIIGFFNMWIGIDVPNKLILLFKRVKR